MSQALPAPTFGHAAEAFVVAHAAPGSWSAGTAVKYPGHGPDSLKHRTLPTGSGTRFSETTRRIGPDSVRHGPDSVRQDTRR